MIEPYYLHKGITIYKNHVLDILVDMKSESINCIMTSPPYWGLRDYGIEPVIWDDKNCAHEWGSIQGQITTQWAKDVGCKGDALNDAKIRKEKRISQDPCQGQFCAKCGAWKGSLGLEPTFELYIKHLCDIFDELKRVLRKDGTCWVNLGDTYGSGKGYDNLYDKNKQDMRGKPPVKGFEKSLLLIPERFAIEMINRGWILRNKIVWYKRNCMPSSANDRFTVDWEPIYFFVKSKKYWFEQQFDKYTAPLDRWGGDEIKKYEGKMKYVDNPEAMGSPRARAMRPQANSLYRERNLRPVEQGRNKRCLWDIPTQPCPDAHFAVFPNDLCVTPIKAGCPEFICKKCGVPREKILKDVGEKTWKDTREKGSKSTFDVDTRGLAFGRLPQIEFQGYTDCGCNAGFEPGVTLDPFMGVGTVLKVSQRLNRQAIGIDIKEDYVKMAIEKFDQEELF